MPSMPKLSTPARSQINSPSVAKISGEAMRMAAAQSEAVKRISMACIIYRHLKRYWVSIIAVTMQSRETATITCAM